MCLPRETNCIYTVGSRVILKCPNQLQGVQLKWFIDGTLADFSQTNVHQETLDGGSYLYISNVTNEWNKVTVRCDILFGSHVVRSSSITISVPGMPLITISLYELYLYGFHSTRHITNQL